MSGLALIVGSLIAACGPGQAKQPSKQQIVAPPGPAGAQDLYRKARLAFGQGRFDDALTLYQRLIDEYGAGSRGPFYYPAGAEAHVAVGDCLLAQKKADKAVKAYQRAMQLYPAGSRHHFPMLKLGDCYMQLGEYERALAAYRQFKRICVVFKASGPKYPKLEIIDRKIRDAERAVRQQQRKNAETDTDDVAPSEKPPDDPKPP